MKLPTAANITNDSYNTAREQTLGRTFPYSSRIEPLREFDKPEVMDFLQKRPVHTVVMMSFIKDNGLEGADNRGTFYGYRNAAGTMEGVALIGHTTLVESRSDDSLTAFALVARQTETPIHFMMSDGETIETFWQRYACELQQPRLVCTELLFELQFPFLAPNCKWNIRLADASELEQIAEAHDAVAFAESGISPLAKDRAGFLKRCLKRIEKKRTFVAFDNGKLVFKADIAAETSDVAYLEGIYVAPEYRGKNVGSECLLKLSVELLNRAQHICLLSNVEFTAAHRSFLKAGFRNTDCCRTIFV